MEVVAASAADVPMKPLDVVAVTTDVRVDGISAGNVAVTVATPFCLSLRSLYDEDSIGTNKLGFSVVRMRRCERVGEVRAPSDEAGRTLKSECDCV